MREQPTLLYWYIFFFYRNQMSGGFFWISNSMFCRQYWNLFIYFTFQQVLVCSSSFVNIKCIFANCLPLRENINILPSAKRLFPNPHPNPFNNQGLLKSRFWLNYDHQNLDFSWTRNIQIWILIPSCKFLSGETNNKQLWLLLLELLDVWKVDFNWYIMKHSPNVLPGTSSSLPPRPLSLVVVSPELSLWLSLGCGLWRRD
jgi:hypothetical protein